MMGDVGRILYVHVPTALGCFVDLSYRLCCWYRIFMDRKKRLGCCNSLEVGVLLDIMLTIQKEVFGPNQLGVSGGLGTRD